jgi:glycosyltransferase involved in cell wall biosynthesis
VRRDGRNRIRVTYLIGSLNLGGAERQLVRLVNGLDPDEFDPSILCLFSGGILEQDLRNNVSCQALSLHRLSETGIRLRGVLGARLLISLYRRLSRERPDILHAIMPSAYVLAGLTGWLARVPVIVAGRRALVTLHSYPHLRWRIASRLANRAITVHLCNSEAVRALAIERERLDPRRTEVILNAVELDLPDQHLRLPTEWIPMEAGPKAAMIANLIPYKGHRVMIEALAQVVRRHPSLKVVLFGDGPERQALETLVVTLNLRPNVVFAGSRPDAPRYLHLFDFALLCSLEEGLPNAVMEAMAAGIPVVASNVGGVPELVRDGEHGRLVPAQDPQALADAMTWLVEHPEERARLGRNAQVRMRTEFSSQTLVQRTQALYRQALGTSTRKVVVAEA